MKLFTFITLFSVIVAVLAVPIEKNEFSKITNALDYPYEKAKKMDISSDCRVAIKNQFKRCLSKEKNIKSICDTFRSEDCQNVIESGIGNIDACKKESKRVIKAFDASIVSAVADVINQKCDMELKDSDDKVQKKISDVQAKHSVKVDAEVEIKKEDSKSKKYQVDSSSSSSDDVVVRIAGPNMNSTSANTGATTGAKQADATNGVTAMTFHYGVTMAIIYLLSTLLF